MWELSLNCKQNVLNFLSNNSVERKQINYLFIDGVPRPTQLSKNITNKKQRKLKVIINKMLERKGKQVIAFPIEGRLDIFSTAVLLGMIYCRPLPMTAT